jgi:DNA-binding NtrC family response regulator
VRQLQSSIQRAVILADGPVIRPQDLHGVEMERIAPGAMPGSAPGRAGVPEARMPQNSGENGSPFLTGDGHIRRLLDIEAEAIARALTIYRGRMAETARRLGIGRSTLYRKIGDLQLDRHGG